jgi:hypothetical protein
MTGLMGNFLPRHSVNPHSASGIVARRFNQRSIQARLEWFGHAGPKFATL